MIEIEARIKHSIEYYKNKENEFNKLAFESEHSPFDSFEYSLRESFRLTELRCRERRIALEQALYGVD